MQKKKKIVHIKTKSKERVADEENFDEKELDQKAIESAKKRNAEDFMEKNDIFDDNFSDEDDDHLD